MLEQVMLKFKNSPICTQLPALMPKNSKQIALLNLCLSQLLWCDPMCFLLLDIAKTEDVAAIFALRVVHCERGKVHKLDFNLMFKTSSWLVWSVDIKNITEVRLNRPALYDVIIAHCCILQHFQSLKSFQIFQANM